MLAVGPNSQILMIDLQSFRPSSTSKPSTIYWITGSPINTFTSGENCDSTVFLTLEEIDVFEESLAVKIFPGEVFEGVTGYQFTAEGEYRINLPSFQGCDSIINLTLDHYQLFTTNVFSPNRAGVNDHFRIYGGADLEEIVELSIYNRWGSQIYQQQNLLTNLQRGWDGRYRGRIVETGVYVYQATIRMDDGIERTRSGSVLVLL